MLGEGGLKNGSITAGRMEDDVTDSEFAQHTKVREKSSHASIQKVE